jgi:hypothetical protein
MTLHVYPFPEANIFDSDWDRAAYDVAECTPCIRAGQMNTENTEGPDP